MVMDTPETFILTKSLISTPTKSIISKFESVINLEIVGTSTRKRSIFDTGETNCQHKPKGTQQIKAVRQTYAVNLGYVLQSKVERICGIQYVDLNQSIIFPSASNFIYFRGAKVLLWIGLAPIFFTIAICASL